MRLPGVLVRFAKMEPRPAANPPPNGQKPQMRHDIGHFPPKQAMV
jgi:hypothetical protein